MSLKSLSSLKKVYKVGIRNSTIILIPSSLFISILTEKSGHAIQSTTFPHLPELWCCYEVLVAFVLKWRKLTDVAVTLIEMPINSGERGKGEERKGCQSFLCSFETWNYFFKLFFQQKHGKNIIVHYLEKVIITEFFSPFFFVKVELSLMPQFFHVKI